MTTFHGVSPIFMDLGSGKVFKTLLEATSVISVLLTLICNLLHQKCISTFGMVKSISFGQPSLSAISIQMWYSFCNLWQWINAVYAWYYVCIIKGVAVYTLYSHGNILKIPYLTFSYIYTVTHFFERCSYILVLIW